MPIARGRVHVESGRKEARPAGSGRGGTSGDVRAGVHESRRAESKIPLEALLLEQLGENEAAPANFAANVLIPLVTQDN